MHEWIQVKPGDLSYPGYMVKKPVGDTDDLPREHGMVVHFAGGDICRIKNVTVDDFEKAVKNAAKMKPNEHTNVPVFIRISNGPIFQLGTVNFVEDYID